MLGGANSNGGDLRVVRNYFEDQITSNSAQIAQYQRTYTLNKQRYCWSSSQLLQALASLKKKENEFNTAAWAEYQWVADNQGKKSESLRKLARVSCELGGRNWTPACDRLLAFYAARDRAI